MMPIRKALKGFVLKVSLRNNIKYFRGFFKTEEAFKKNNKLVDHLSGNKILILAPHIDDEMIGCGGGIISYIKSGKEVFVAYLTNGAKRGKEGMSRSEVIATRRDEALSIAELIGLAKENMFFLNGEDGKLANSNIKAPLFDILKKVNPDTIFLPVTLDTHIDHFASSKLLYEIYRDNESTFWNKSFYLYEAQSPITQKYSNITLDISTDFEYKKQLLKIYKSQNMEFDFVNINRINGIIFDLEACEVFIKTEAKEFFDFYERNFTDWNSYFSVKSKLVMHHDSRDSIASYLSSLNHKEILKELTYLRDGL